LEGHR